MTKNDADVKAKTEPGADFPKLFGVADKLAVSAKGLLEKHATGKTVSKLKLNFTMPGHPRHFERAYNDLVATYNRGGMSTRIRFK